MTQRTKGLAAVLAVVAVAGAGAWYFGRSTHHGAPGAPMIPAPVAAPADEVTQMLQALRVADDVPDPVARCRQMPLPEGWTWSPAMIEAFCADGTTPRLSSQAVWNMIRANKGAQLDAHYEELTDNYYAGRIPEGTYWLDFYNKFSYNDSGTTEAIDDWLKQRPDSAHAHVASAIHHASVAWGHRGTRYVHQIPPENMAKMDAEVALATAAARRAIELDPRSLPAYSTLVRLAMIGGGRAQADRAFEDGLKQDPKSYFLRIARLDMQDPKWGGSLEDVDATAREAQVYAKDNPRLPALLAEAEGYHAYAACPEDGQVCENAGDYFRAYRHGPSWNHAGWAISTLEDNELWLRVVELSTQMLRFSPDMVDTRLDRASALVMLRQNPWAVAEYRRMLQADGDNITLLRSFAWALRRMNRFEEAVEPMRRLLAADPTDRDNRHALAHVYLYRLRRLDDAKPLIDDMLRDDPTDGGAHLLHVDWLQNRNAGEDEIAEAARGFVQHADTGNDEQARALPKVKAWLAKRGGTG